MYITVVGCGFVGSIFTDELLKRCFAGNIPRPWRFIDFDKVSDRNSANQNFIPSDVGKPKAEILKWRAEHCGYLTDTHTERLTAANAAELLKNSAIIVDAVDNLETRQLLWAYGMKQSVPVLHVGISEMGTGAVEWSHPSHDTFSLSPIHTAGKTLKDPVSGVTPPCELARMRGLGLNTAFAAAKAAAIFFGFDPEHHVEVKKTNGWLTDWVGGVRGHEAVPSTWSKV